MTRDHETHEVPPPGCREVLSVARGDERDPLVLRQHLAVCAGCRSAVATTRALSSLAREALASPAAPGTARRVLAEIRGQEEPRRVPAFAWPSFAASGLAIACILALSVALLPGNGGSDVATVAETSAKPGFATPTAGFRPHAPNTASARSAGLVLEIRGEATDRLRYVLRSPAGMRQGEVELTPHYELDTVPANAVVVDTF